MYELYIEANFLRTWHLSILPSVCPSVTSRCHIVNQFNEGLYDVCLSVCRCHIVNQFNEGLYDIIIAADEVAVEDANKRKDEGKKQRR